MPRKGRRRTKSRTHADPEAVAGTLTNSEEGKIPKSLVIRRGKCEMIVGDLVTDVRKVMMPYTASHFQEDAKYRKLTLARYCQNVCLPLGISHMMAFSQNQEKLTLRIAKTPQGPTLSFRVHQFSLAKHIQKLQRRPMNANTVSQSPPIVVTNNFGDAKAPPQIKLMRITFQTMFPAINVATVRLKECRRVVLFHLLPAEDDNKEDRVEMRHYAIKATPVGVNKKIRRLIQAKIPNLNKVQDIADYIEGQGASATTSVDAASDSEPEDGNAVVELAQNYAGRGNKSQLKSALKLVELGPRLTLQLVKVEQGLVDGNVMYHAHVNKTPAEVKELQQKVKDRDALKTQRRDEQDKNVARKRKVQEEKRDAKRKRREEREEQALQEMAEEGSDDDGFLDQAGGGDDDASDNDDDLGIPDEDVIDSEAEEDDDE